MKGKTGLKRHAKPIACGLGLLFVLGCSEPDFILPGERYELRGNEPLSHDRVENVVAAHDPGAAVSAADWTHINGTPSHVIAHPALDSSLSLQWSQSIGQGNGKRHRITATPVLANGVLYTLDSRSTVTAISTSGATLWSRNLTPAADAPDDASGGGISVSGGLVFVTTAFGELTVLNTDSGAVVWTQDFESAATAAPTVLGDTVYAVTQNEMGWALDVGSGQILWQVLGASSSTGLTGGSAPAVSGDQVIFPFSSGQMVAADRSSGGVRWSASVAGERIGRAFSRISDLTGDPIVSGGVVYAGNHAGSVAAFDEQTGLALWTSNFGAAGSIWLSGNSVFLVSDENQLVRLDASTGQPVWAVELPFFTREKFSRRKTAFAHYGPVLAGGRLFVPSDEGFMRIFDPESGAGLGTVSLPSGAASNPIVAGGALYIVTENGQLHAFR